jgi:hypothetical protein
VACCFVHQVDVLCLAHQAVELLGIAGAFLALEECVVGVIVLFLIPGMEWCLGEC